MSDRAPRDTRKRLLQVEVAEKVKQIVAPLAVVAKMMAVIVLMAMMEAVVREAACQQLRCIR